MTDAPWDRHVRLSGQATSSASHYPPFICLNSAYRQSKNILTACLFTNEQNPTTIQIEAGVVDTVESGAFKYWCYGTRGNIEPTKRSSAKSAPTKNKPCPAGVPRRSSIGTIVPGEATHAAAICSGNVNLKNAFARRREGESGAI
jgi:hypothetical protein